ncbi:MAG: hypothetical protein M1818_001789 [Claussenomyces sp. TS43310]|nr:MAG: hypothetical protein M1818_001789 [Claussenomyces sp. TS43310]
MSSGQLARNRALSLGSGRSSKGRIASMDDFSMPQTNLTREFDPCDATASMFLYAQGNSIVVAHHDTLTIERRFSRHTEEVKLLAVDNVSERGAGRLVISYDAGQTAIVWDLMTGDEIARFASYNDLSVAAWMRNGNVAFGNAQGNVILFEPSTSEHISARTIDQVPITALAPASDCRTYAIGYQNGSLLIAALQPRFTILHNLSTSRAPSPIITLAWHASSSRQKSDMLATQTRDGDLRVWSITKSSSSSDPAKVVRVLRKSDNLAPGPNWLGWSKNGRIVQYSEGETSSWDVRTKNVTCENVPTLEHVRGLAIYGPGATLFTLGPNNTAQQFDLHSPPVLVANVQHPANLLPPSPPVSIEEQKKGATSNLPNEYSSVPINIDVVSESDEDHMSPLARIAREMDELEEETPERSDAMSPASSKPSYTSRSSVNSQVYRKHGSVASRGLSDHTMMSMGSSFQSREPSVVSSRDNLSVSSLSSTSTSSHRSRPRHSRLRQEVLRSPEDKVVIDLFKFTKSRLSDVPHARPQVPGSRKLSVNELRCQMLSTIFGWDGDVEELIRDEMRRHPVGSTNRVLLAKWLGDLDTDIMASSSESMTSSDWMLLALSGIGGQASQQKVARAYVQRLLEKGDVHTAATIMFGMGDQNDAIEIYVSHKRYMEALILSCYVYPADWGRQTQLIRRWGEWAVQHSQQQLAIRCFSCTGSETQEPYFSPAPQSSTFPSLTTPGIPEMLSPPLSPPGVVPRGPQRNMAKTAALKLVTSFGDKNSTAKFFGSEGAKTPMNAGVTPIAESALSPSGHDASQTAFLRPSQRSVYNTPASARTATPGGFTRGRLPSIGETPSDVAPMARLAISRPTTDDDTSSELSSSTHGRSAYAHKNSQPETLQLNATTYNPTGRANTASPMMQRSVKLANPLPSPSPEVFGPATRLARARNGSQDRKPDGLHIQWPPMESIITGDYMTTPELSATTSRNRAPTAGSVAGSTSSISVSGKSERSYKSYGVSSPASTSRSLDQYISSLESAAYSKPGHRARQASRDIPEDRAGRGRNSRSSSRKPKAREPSTERGRSGMRFTKSGKRSPTSPVPMSPEDIRGMMPGFGANDDDTSDAVSRHSQSRRTRSRDTSRATAIQGSRTTSRVRKLSPAQPDSKKKPAGRSARAPSGRSSPNPSQTSYGRSRSKLRDDPTLRSPSSPRPMSPVGTLSSNAYQKNDDEDDLRAAVADQERFRSRQRSAIRAKERGPSSARHLSPERKHRARSTSRHGGGCDSSSTREEPRRGKRTPSHKHLSSDLKVGDIQQIKIERQRKKEAAAKELEERRRSLVRRPSAPPIVYPEQLSPAQVRPASRSEGTRIEANQFPNPLIRSQTVSPDLMRQASARFQEPTQPLQVGLPATPRAMQHPKYDPQNKEVPDVPQIPESYTPLSQIALGSLDAIVQDENSDTFGPLPQTTFTPLPKTTYSATPRHIPPRSMSAPIPEEPTSPQALPAALPTHPAFHAALPPSSRRRDQGADNDVQGSSSRKVNPGDAQPGTLGYEARNNTTVYSNPPLRMGGIEETLESGSHRTNHDNSMMPPPPPPPPAPPILRELQHLAMPPPPPPVPLYRMVTSNNGQPIGPRGTGIIEIVMDGDEEAPVAPSQPTFTDALALQPLPSLEPRAHSANHSRGHSIPDNSLSGRFARASVRMRSGSRGTSPQLTRTKSPSISGPMEYTPAPYESLTTKRWVMEQLAFQGPKDEPVARTERRGAEEKAETFMGAGDMI